MTFVVKQDRVGNYSISIEQEKFCSAYHVRMDRIEDGWHGYRISDLIYPTIEKANRRYNYLRRKIIKGEV